MKYLIAVLLLLSFASNANCQSITELDLVGTWKTTNVINISEVPKEQEKNMEILKAAFLMSKFEFKADKKSNFLIPDFKVMEIRNERWNFNSDQQIITIQEWKDREFKKRSLLDIEIIFEDEKTFFQIVDLPLKLEVIKE